MASKDKPEPTLSDVLKNADKATTLPGLLPDPAAYMVEALARGGKIIEASDTPTGFAATTWEFSGSDEPYTEVVYTSEHFPETPSEADARLEALAAGVEAALNPDAQETGTNMEVTMEAPPTASPVSGTAEPVALPELTHYSNPLREHLLVQSAYYGAEIDRLARLTENAMKAQAAVHNALSSLDRDGV